MLRAPTRAAATALAALGALTLSACGGDEPPAKPPPRDSAVANCAGNECRVRVRCKGRIYVRSGTAPVRVHSSRSPLVTTFIADFAGSREDALIRC